MFLGMYVIYYYVYIVDQIVELFWYQMELFEYFRQFQNFFLCGSMVVVFCFDGVVCNDVLCVQFSEFFVCQFRVNVVVVIGGVIVVVFFIFVIIQVFLGEFRIDVSCGWCYFFFCVWIDKVGDKIG